MKTQALTARTVNPLPIIKWLDLALAAAVGEIALAGFVALLWLSRICRAAADLLHGRKKGLILFALGSVAGALAMAVGTLALLLDESLGDAALLLVALCFSHGRLLEL